MNLPNNILASGFWLLASRARRPRRGMSLLLAITMMGGLLFITSAAANLIWTVSKSSRSIGESENAYFAALTAVEKALYEYEKGTGSVLNLQVPTPRPVPGNAAATYTTSAVVDAYAPAFTTALTADGSATQPISTSNRLNVDIPAGETFYFNLATQGVTYPSNIEVSLASGSNVRVTTFMLTTQSTQIFNATNDKLTLNMPSGSTNDTRFTAANLSTSVARIQVKPTGGNLPLGITVTGVGQYKNTLRKVEVSKPNWVFY